MLSSVLDCLKQWMNPPALGGPALPGAVAGPPTTNTDSQPIEAAAPELAREDLKRAGSLLRHAGELTTAVAEEVGQHQSQIQTINVELEGVAERRAENAFGRRVRRRGYAPCPIGSGPDRVGQVSLLEFDPNQRPHWRHEIAAGLADAAERKAW